MPEVLQTIYHRLVNALDIETKRYPEKFTSTIDLKLGFEKGRNIEKSTVPSARGIRVSLRHLVKSIKRSKAAS